jgi:predicted regulator of Ras-like GTPase activity (Roadblock/LC7/MglB family)
LLADVLRDGGFSMALLGDEDGFPVASAVAPGEEAEARAAAVALMQRSASQARARLGLGTTDEIMLHDDRGRRLVCRPFHAGDHDLILIVLVPERRQPYRKTTNRALRDLRRMLESGRE